MKPPLLLPAGSMAMISSLLWTKYWYVNIFDGPDKWMYGFPFPARGDALHTSLAIDVYLLESLLDFMVYFLFWWGVLYAFDRWIMPIKMNKVVQLMFVSCIALCLGFSIFAISVSEPSFYLTCPYEVEIIETKCCFLWQDKTLNRFQGH